MSRVIILLFSCWAYVAPAQCDLKLDKDSIQVYTCKTDDSKYKAIKVTFWLDATPAQVKAMLLDIDHLGDWQFSTAKAHLIKKVSSQEIIYYTEVKVPVAQNRDFIIDLKIDHNTTTKEMKISATNLPTYLPIKKNIIRVPMSKATWQIKEIRPRRLHVEYNVRIDFGGEIPAWVVNSLSHKAPYETFKNMKEKIRMY
jgi:ribosome-associated toxin RatA of RatAB toxin-antitoxin module